MYLHEKKGYGHLHKLGQADEPSYPPAEAGLGAALGHYARKHMKTGPQPMPDAAKAEEMKRAYMASAIRRAQQQRDAGQVAQYNTMAAAPGQADLQRAQQNMQTNDLADMTRLGGRFTPNGLESADVNATTNASDRLRAKSMIGQAQEDDMRRRSMIGVGGTLVPMDSGGF